MVQAYEATLSIDPAESWLVTWKKIFKVRCAPSLETRAIERKSFARLDPAASVPGLSPPPPHFFESADFLADLFSFLVSFRRHQGDEQRALPVHNLDPVLRLLHAGVRQAFSIQERL